MRLKFPFWIETVNSNLILIPNQTENFNIIKISRLNWKQTDTHYLYIYIYGRLFLGKGKERKKIIRNLLGKKIIIINVIQYYKTMIIFLIDNGLPDYLK